MNLYGEWDVESCAQHIEAKKLANKLYHRRDVIQSKIDSELEKELTQFSPSRHEQLQNNWEKVDSELKNIRRGLMRCCAVN